MTASEEPAPPLSTTATGAAETRDDLEHWLSDLRTDVAANPSGWIGTDPDGDDTASKPPARIDGDNTASKPPARIDGDNTARKPFNWIGGDNEASEPPVRIGDDTASKPPGWIRGDTGAGEPPAASPNPPGETETGVSRPASVGRHRSPD